MSDIATRWHRLGDAIKEDRIRTFTDSDGNCLPYAARGDVKKDFLESCIKAMSLLPRFMIEESAVQLVRTDQSLFSISDMITCDVFRLPYTECVVEYDHHGVMYSVLLREHDLPDGLREWECSLFGYRGRNLNDDAAVVFPCAACLTVEGPAGNTFDTDVSSPQYPIIDYSVKAASFFKKADTSRALLEDAHLFVFERSLTAFLAAMILPKTIGISRELVDIKKGFNKSRISKGKHPVPNYTYIRLESRKDPVQTSQPQKAGVAVHLRRAHKRRIAVGEGRTGRVWRFFPPQVVGYLPDGRKPSVPEILATRAAKPYLVR